MLVENSSIWKCFISSVWYLINQQLFNFFYWLTLLFVHELVVIHLVISSYIHTKQSRTIKSYAALSIIIYLEILRNGECFYCFIVIFKCCYLFRFTPNQFNCRVKWLFLDIAAYCLLQLYNIKWSFMEAGNPIHFSNDLSPT